MPRFKAARSFLCSSSFFPTIFGRLHLCDRHATILGWWLGGSSHGPFARPLLLLFSKLANHIEIFLGAISHMKATVGAISRP